MPADFLNVHIAMVAQVIAATDAIIIGSDQYVPHQSIAAVNTPREMISGDNRSNRAKI
jgi:hypothetical protein